MLAIPVQLPPMTFLHTVGMGTAQEMMMARQPSQRIAIAIPATEHPCSIIGSLVLNEPDIGKVGKKPLLLSPSLFNLQNTAQGR
jgi:hypothetical protein